MSVADEIKSRLDIVSYINQYVPLKKAGRSHKACCPFHGEKTPSFVVNDDRQSWRCFGACSEGGDIFSFAMKYHGWDFKEALYELGAQAGVEVRKRTPEQKEQADRADYLRGLLKEVAEAYHKKLYDREDAGAVEALRYAREERGLSDETIRAFGIGYAPPGWSNVLDHLTELGYEQDDVIEAGLALRSDRSGSVYDRFRNRFMVPIRDRRGRVVGFGGRILDPEDSPKYMNSPQTPVFDKSTILFGLDLARDTIRDTETAVIVEGYMDAITAYQAGFKNVVAQMGTAMTEEQLRLVAPKHAKRIVMALDSDAAGQNATMRSLEVAREALSSDLSGKLDVALYVLQIPGAKDPDDLIREDAARWEKLVADATPVADYVIEAELAALPEKPTVQQREAVARSLVPILTATDNSLYGQENLQKLAMRLLIPERDLSRIAEQVQQEEAQRRRYRENRKQNETPPPTYSDDDAPPPRQYTDAEANGVAVSEEPPPLDHSGSSNGEGLAAPRPATRKRLSLEVRHEAHVLNQLLEYPEVYYRVNGQLHEAAGGDERLLRHAMASFGADDFRHTGLRFLMATFIEGLEQDEMDPADYVYEQADDALRDEINLVSRNRMTDKLKDETAVAPGDLQRVRDKIQRSGVLVNPAQDLIAGALRLRCRRLHQERDELRLMQANAIAAKETEQVDTLSDQIDLLARAVHTLEIMQQQVARLY